MRIASDGTWFYRGSPIGRAPLVQLFASILRKDEDRYVLVTPVERVGIGSTTRRFWRSKCEWRGRERAAYISHQRRGFRHRRHRTSLRFETGAADGVKPYVKVRGDLWALVKRALFYDLVALGRR